MIPRAALDYAAKAATGIDGVVAIVLAGSFARDDERPMSDIDLLVVLERVDLALLDAIGTLTRGMRSTNEINPTVVSRREFASYPDLHGYLKYQHDGIPLHGELPAPTAPHADELAIARRIAHEVMMSARHYLAVKEEPAKFQSGKLFGYILKPLSFALRFHHYHVHGRYIRSYADLSGVYPVLAKDPRADHAGILGEAHRICVGILGAEDAGGT
jgi:hypothetical protein